MTTYLESDDIELDDEPLYKGEVVRASTTSLWDQPVYVPPKDVCTRDGADDFKDVPSLGFGAQAIYPRHHP